MEEGHWSNNSNLFSHGCFLSAYGIGFEPELFLSEPSFDPELIIFKGSMGLKTFEWVGKVRPRTKKIFEYTHLILKISKSESSAVRFEEATNFFNQYRDEVLRLSKFHNVEHIILQFKGIKDEQENLTEEFTKLAAGGGVSVISGLKINE